MTAVDGYKNRRLARLTEINNDNKFKLEQPFEYQVTLLGKEIADITTAKNYAISDANAAYNDLIARMTEYRNDVKIGLNNETDKVLRAIERGFTDHKKMEDVLEGMRIDFLQGVYLSGNVYHFDDDVYDLSVFDTIFDDFEYEIGHGTGHGHASQSYNNAYGGY